MNESGNDFDQHLIDEREAADKSGKGAHPFVRALLSGLTGAATVNLLNEGARRVSQHAPRMEVIGERALQRSLRLADVKPPRGRALYRWALAGDVAGNTFYYSLAGLGSRRGARRRGAVLGLLAGLGAVFLTKPLGLGRQPDEDTPVTQALTVAWYTAAGIAAGAASHALSGSDSSR